MATESDMTRRQAINQTMDPERQAMQAYLNSEEYRQYLKEREKNQKNRARALASANPTARAMQKSASKAFMDPAKVRSAATAFAEKGMEEKWKNEQAKKAMQTQIALYHPSVRAPKALNQAAYNQIKGSTNPVTGSGFAGGRADPNTINKAAGTGNAGLKYGFTVDNIQGPKRPYAGRGTPQMGPSADARINSLAQRQLGPWIQGLIGGKYQAPRGLWGQTTPTVPHQQLMPTDMWNNLSGQALAQRQASQLPLAERLKRIRAQKPGYINPLLEKLGWHGGIL